jgi:hypothetical protein
MRVYVWVPGLPPSANRIYETAPRKIKGKWIQVRHLSDRARVYKRRAIQIIQREGGAMFDTPEANIPYELRLVVFLEQVENKTYPKATKSRFKKIDLSNHAKLIEDAVSTAIGLDDKHNFRVSMEKQCDPEDPGILIMLEPVPEEEVGLTREEYDVRLRQNQQDRTGGTSSPLRFFARPSGASKRHTDRADRGEDQ